MCRKCMILAVALSMDAFAVSLTMGAAIQRKFRKFAILAGLYLGLFSRIKCHIWISGRDSRIWLAWWLFAHWLRLYY